MIAKIFYVVMWWWVPSYTNTHVAIINDENEACVFMKAQNDDNKWARPHIFISSGTQGELEEVECQAEPFPVKYRTVKKLAKALARRKRAG